MSDTTWIPGLIVLATGLGLGLLLAFRLRQQGQTRRRRERGTDDVDLQIRDLEARRDDLYRRIREAEGENLSPAEIDELEKAAALTLRELDRLGAASPASTVAADATPSPQVAAGGRPSSSRPASSLLKALAWGAALVLVVTLLVYWAVRDAQPRAGEGMPTPMAAGTAEEAHQGQVPIPPELAARVAELRARIDTDPDDWQAHRELAINLVAGGQFMEAFEEASLVLQQFPDDADGLLVHGVVRLTMGQPGQAIQLLDRVLAERPSHRQALLYRGLALYQQGSVTQAMDTWEMGLQMAGGSDPEFEELLAMAQAAPPAGTGPMPADHPPVTSAAASAIQEPFAADPSAYPLRIELAAETQVGPQASLFVYLQPEEGGPPVAVRRIAAPTFPVQLNLGPNDSMMGDELPASGTLVARLDADSDVATTGAFDLSASAPATRGELIRLVLGQ